MNKKNTARVKWLRPLWRLSPTAILLVALLVVAAVTTLAQGEDLNSKTPERSMEPEIVSQEVMPDGTTQTQVLIPVSDNTYTTSNNPSTTWCGSNWLRLGYSLSAPNNGAERIYLRFDLSSIPSNATVNSAYFQIYQHTISPSGDSEQMAVQSRHLASSWSQCSVTWGNSPAWGGVIDSGSIPNTIGWIQADGTNLVRQWVGGQHANNGVLLQGDERVQQRERIFYSSRDFSRYPRLVVNYSEFVDNEPPQVSVEPLPQWSPASFTVRWSGTDPGGSGIAYYDVQYRVPGQNWIPWLSGTTATSAQYVGSEGHKYEFQARGVDKAGNVQSFPNTPQASTTVDTTPPNAKVDTLPPYIYEEPFTVSWDGTDNASGIKCYDVQYEEGGGTWHDAFTCTTLKSVEVTGALDGVTYYLRARATDNAGNVQPWSGAQTQTTISTGGPTAYIQPFASPVTIDPNITVRWTGGTSPGATITYFSVQYRFGLGPWILWINQTQDLSAVFNATQTGQYCFEARAADSVPRVEQFKNLPEYCIVLDTDPPSISPRLYLPNIWKGAFK